MTARVAVKDVIDVAGMPTTAASKILDRVPERDAECVARPPGRRRGDRREAEHARVRARRADEQPPFRPGPQPVGPRADDRGSTAGAARPSPPGSSTSRSVPTRRLDPHPVRVLRGHRPPAVHGSSRPAASSPSRGVSTRSAPSPVRPRNAGGRWRSWRGRRSSRAASLGSASSPGSSRRRPPRSPPLPGACRALPGSHVPVELPLLDEIATITQLVMLPEAAAAHLGPLKTRLADYGPDVRARLLAGLLLPSTAYVTGLRARRWVRSLWEPSSATSTCSSRRRCRSLRPAWTRFRPTTGCRSCRTTRRRPSSASR